MSESCELCGAYELSYNGFICHKSNRFFEAAYKEAAAEICKHYPVPKPKPSAFEVWNAKQPPVGDYGFTERQRGWQACNDAAWKLQQETIHEDDWPTCIELLRIIHAELDAEK